MSSFCTYLIGFVILIVGLAIGAYLMGAPPMWIGVGVICGIGEFRGLESRAVLLVDMEHLPEGDVGESLLYIGMSRSSAMLHMLVPPAFGQRLEQLVKRAG